MFDRRRFVTGLVAVLLAFAVAGPVRAQQEAQDDQAKQFVASLADRAFQSLIRTNTPRAQRVEQFRKLFDDAFATRAIGKWVLGRYWNEATEAQQQEYLKLFEDLMVYSYVDRFATYTGDSLQVGTAVREDETYTTVQTSIPRPGANAQPIDVRWRVGKTGNTFKIVDVVVEGVSMSTTLRSQFASIISRNGGQISGLIDELRQKTRELGSPA